ncbi:hypothetical protein BX616_010644 [Lobosporangium transversale]|uniref:Coiled-coil domain-containing protein 16 n=1 Tax=Lobosporangium transversale TaxID=64571 RepID=A0A1Y2H382_9FUNG|nr:hypothetical protein BCR41DRAFT_345428 [Lobosporangium transversale]KAF9911173.1 hypothetical protein BX616_010644 [Lobosporangium transversale]ORZ28494.1 hypothetical protein BCR41DRAFT_345428 [Lobosporangium transversale]|eukprot:XP_021886179.1 hypothetical protein BCR41DRAFT_345428 [Lobosporangium transversale]
MSKDVRRLFAAQKAAKITTAGAGSTSPSLASSSSSAKRVTHPLAKYDPKTFRLTCAICGPAVSIKSDSLWNAHLVSKSHQEAVAKLRAVKEQVQKKEAEAAERLRLQQEQQKAQGQAQQGVKRKAPGGLVAYVDDDSESESEDEKNEASVTKSSVPAASESKRVKIDHNTVEEAHRQAATDIEEEEDAMAGLPAGFFDSSSANTAVEGKNDEENGVQEAEPMDGVLPAGFFDDPEEDARARVDIGGATANQQQRQADEEFKALQAALAQDMEELEEQEAALRSGQAVVSVASTATQGPQTSSEHIPYEEKVELEEQELEESILARSEEEYQLFVEMQERLDALREKKNRLLAMQSAPSPSESKASSIATSTGTKKPVKKKKKSILDLVREQEKARKEKERLAAQEFAKMSAAAEGDRRMTSDDDESDDDEDIEAMMDWRAKRF